MHDVIVKSCGEQRYATLKMGALNDTISIFNQKGFTSFIYFLPCTFKMFVNHHCKPLGNSFTTGRCLVLLKSWKKCPNSSKNDVINILAFGSIFQILVVTNYFIQGYAAWHMLPTLPAVTGEKWTLHAEFSVRSGYRRAKPEFDYQLHKTNEETRAPVPTKVCLDEIKDNEIFRNFCNVQRVDLGRSTKQRPFKIEYSILEAV